MYLRFVVGRVDPQSRRRQGLFHAVGALRASDRVSPSDVDRLNGLRDWFADNLPVPTRFSLSPKPHRKAQALSWFKDDAASHIGRMREYKEVLETYDVAVEMLRTRRPGYIVYEDYCQVVSYPFADTPC